MNNTVISIVSSLMTLNVIILIFFVLRLLKKPNKQIIEVKSFMSNIKIVNEYINYHFNIMLSEKFAAHRDPRIALLSHIDSTEDNIINDELTGMVSVIRVYMSDSIIKVFTSVYSIEYLEDYIITWCLHAIKQIHLKIQIEKGSNKEQDFVNILQKFKLDTELYVKQNMLLRHNFENNKGEV